MANIGIIERTRASLSNALLGIARVLSPSPSPDVGRGKRGGPVSAPRQEASKPGRKGRAKIPASKIPSNEFEIAEGDRIAYEPINVNATFHNGHLYYPIETLVRQKVVDDEGHESFVEQTEVIVVRSDRTVHRAQASKSPADGSASKKVHRLTDGTLIEGAPRANPHGTWSFESVSAYLEGEGEDYDLGALARSVHQHLYSRIWLPNDDDYWLLTFIALTSYVQSVFDAVPLCLVCGPAGSGKSELGAAVAQVSANAIMIGQTSPATMMRLIDESGGLVVIDDLEAIGGRAGKGRKDERFSEIAQALKVSYKKSTATKAVTDARTKRTQVLNFFGVKLLNNTTGASGATLGSRMVRVTTQYLPDEKKASFLSRAKIPESELAELRNQLHTWAMSHVAVLREAYLESVTDKTMREEEIAAPLRVLAGMTKDTKAIAALERSLENDDLASMEPDDLLAHIVRKLTLDGYRAITLQHVLLEMRLAYQGETSDSDLDWLKIEWVGRRLKQLNIASDKFVRKRLHGAHLRIVQLEENYLADLARKNEGLQAKREPFDFCDKCSSCRFASVSCEIAARRWRGDR